MQQHHYSAAHLTGDSTFPTHLTPRQALALVRSHSVEHAELRADGTLFAAVGGSVLVDGISAPASFPEIFKPTSDGLFRAARLLLWLGY
jgi:hypothetical protein